MLLFDLFYQFFDRMLNVVFSVILVCHPMQIRMRLLGCNCTNSLSEVVRTKAGTTQRGCNLSGNRALPCHGSTTDETNLKITNLKCTNSVQHEVDTTMA